MDVPKNDESCSETNVSLLTEKRICLNTKSDSNRNINIEEKDNLKSEETINQKLENYSCNHKESRVKICASDNVSEQINERYIKNDNCDSNVGDDEIDDSNENEINKDNGDHQKEGTQITKIKIKAKDLSDKECTIRANEDIQICESNGQEILDSTSEKIQKFDVKIIESDKKLSSKVEQSSSNTDEKKSEKSFCQEDMEIKNSEKHHHDLHVLNKAVLPESNVSSIASVILDDKSCCIKNQCKDLNEVTQEIPILNKQTGEIENENISSNLETENIDNSDTSALMELAEIACKTNNKEVPKEIKSCEGTPNVISAGSDNINTTDKTHYHTHDWEGDDALKGNSKSLDEEKRVIPERENEYANILINSDNQEFICSNNSVVKSPNCETEQKKDIYNDESSNILNALISNDTSASISTEKHANNDSCKTECHNSVKTTVDMYTSIRDYDANEIQLSLNKEKSCKVSSSKLNILETENINKEKLSLVPKNLKEISPLNIIKDSALQYKECTQIITKETNISAEFHGTLENEVPHLNINRSQHSTSFHKNDNLEINEESLSTEKHVKNNSYQIENCDQKAVVDKYTCEKDNSVNEGKGCKVYSKLYKQTENINEQTEKVSVISKNYKEINFLNLNENSDMQDKECPRQLINKEIDVSVERRETLENNEVLNSDIDKSQQPISLHKEDEFEINKESTTVKSPILSLNYSKNTLETPTDIKTLTTNCANKEALADICQQIGSGYKNEAMKDSSTFPKDNSISVKENSLQPTPVVQNSKSKGENNLLSSGMIENDSLNTLSLTKNNLHLSEKENTSHFSQIQNTVYSVSPKSDSDTALIESSSYSVSKSSLNNSEVKKNSHSSKTENNLSSLIEKDSHSTETENNSASSLERDISRFEGVEGNPLTPVSENTLHSILEENNSYASLNLVVKEQTTVISNNSSSCPKIYIRKDLHESLENSSNNENSEVIDSEYLSVTHKENSNKRTSPEDTENIKPVKKMSKVVDVCSNEESSDEEKLVIDEGKTNLKNLENKKIDSKFRSKKPNYLSENDVKSQTSITHCDSNKKIEDKSTSISNVSKLKPVVEVVDLVEGDDSTKVLMKKNKNLNDDKNFICEKCKDIWNDKVLKLLFEGSESVTVNSRITYGAIICMNIYVSVHYPKIKEQALIGLLDRADLAKNLGSIQVSLLNNWLVALINNKKISCCDPFRPVYRAKAPSQVHANDTAKLDSKEASNNNDKCMEGKSLETSLRERCLGSAASNQICSTPEIVIDDDIDLNQSHDERNAQNNDSEMSPSCGKNYMRKISTGIKTGSTISDLKNNGVLTNGKAFTKQFAKSNPISYSIIQRERESLSTDLHDAYDKLVYESKLTEEEAKTGKRKILTNKEILCIHSIFILNAKEILIEKYYRFLFQLLYHRGNILLIPDGKLLVKRVETIRKEHNRMKFSAMKNKAFLAQSWDIDNIYTVPLAKPVNKKNEYNVKVRDILSVFCFWKNNKLLSYISNSYDLREEVLKLYENQIEMTDCFGLCIKLYTNYSRLLFSLNETESMKTKVFLNLFYLPNKYLSSMENTLIFDSEITYFPPANRNSSDIIDYLEKQTKKGTGQVKRSYLDSVIDAKLQQAKRLRTDLLNSMKSPQATFLMESYAKLKNELNYLEVEPINQLFKTVEDSQEENLIKSSTYTSEVKLIIAKLRASNVDSEYIPIILEKVFHNIFKRKIPTL